MTGVNSVLKPMDMNDQYESYTMLLYHKFSKCINKHYKISR